MCDHHKSIGACPRCRGRAGIDELKEKLRWRKWPEEKPESAGNVLIREKDGTHDVAFYASFEKRFVRHNRWITPTYWLPIPPIGE